MAVVLCLLLLCSFGCSQIFVHPEGTDSNPGTRHQPLKSISTAVERLSSSHHPKNEIILLDGSYDGFSITWTNSRSVLMIRSENPGMALVSGGIFIPTKDFLVHGDLAVTNLPISNPGDLTHGGLGSCSYDFTEVFADGQPLHQARYPNIQSNGLFGWMNVQNPKGNSSFDAQVGARAHNWVTETDPWVHGYWNWDWWDSYTKVTSISVLPSGTAVFQVSDNIAAEHKARFYITNVKSELDSVSEYYIDKRKLQLFLYAPNGNFPFKNGVWISNKSPWVVDLSNSVNVVLDGVSVVYGRGGGVNCQNCTNVRINNVNVSMHSREGINLEGKSNRITKSSVTYTGCTGITVNGGSKFDLIPFNNLVEDNDIHNYARLTRTYNPGIKWGGVGSSYYNNRVSHGPHNAFLGGGNEADGCNNIFKDNTIAHVAYETCDTGAFYTCGQSGQAFICRGNKLIGNTFIDIRTKQETPLGYPSVQAIYLDDQSSGWTIENNTFIDCQKGIFVGGGRDNQVTENKCTKVDTCLHLDNRGMNWEKATCEDQNLPGAESVKPKLPPWSVQFPEVARIPNYHPCVPVNNTFQKNIWCNGNLSDFSTETASEWLSTLADNINKC